jgi:hypothetical protein
MKQQVYNLVLSQHLIDLVDELAVGEQLSRSAMLNQILGEYFKVDTLGMTVVVIINHLQRLLVDYEQLEQRSPYSLVVRSTLAYPYHPTISYQLDILRSWDRFYGQLTINFRARSPLLISKLNRFYQLWVVVNNDYTVSYDPANCRFVKLFELADDWVPVNLAQEVSEYVRGIDQILKLYITDQEFEAVVMEDYCRRLIWGRR